MDCAALIVAAGRGSRFGPGLPKQYQHLAGEPILRHTVRAFLHHPQVNRVQVVIHPDDAEMYAATIAGLALPPPVAGGASRQESVLRGLECLAPAMPAQVLIHDAARPLVSSALIDRVTLALRQGTAAIPALPVVDTLKRTVDPQSGLITGTVERQGLWRAQTPQGFPFAAILAAHRHCVGQQLTDDAAVAEACGIPVALVEGDEDNFKVTTERDLHVADRMLRPVMETRTASGFDVHRFCEGDHVMLCGIAVPHDQGLLGHSDADVGLHALTDALLGTLGAGDIGRHFPPSDPQWRGAPSDVFLRHAVALLQAAGGKVIHLDVTLICERPKIGRHRDDMRARVAEIATIAATRVSIKATTTEQLGFTGRREGIAAQAVATVQLPSAD